MEMEVEDDDAVGLSWLGYNRYKHQTASPTANITHAMCLTCTHI